MLPTEKSCCVCLFFFHILVFALTLAVEKCPCKIYDNNNIADCRRNNSGFLPTCIPRSVKKLIYSDNALMRLYQRQFEKFSELVYLDLTRCAISYICREAFKGLSVLDTLLLSRNKISVLDIYTFDGLFKLQKLNLQLNKIKEIKNYVFEPLSNLKKLDLERNHIVRLKPSTFKGLSSLKQLKLNYNPLCDRKSFPLDVFQPLFKLEELDMFIMCSDGDYLHIDLQLKWLISLRKIRFYDIPNHNLGEGFTNLSSLEEIIIRGCRSSCISPETFQNLNKSPLKKLTLRCKYLNQVYPSTFSSLHHLESLNLSNNSALCELGFHNLTIGLKFTNIKVLNLQRICGRPWILGDIGKHNLGDTNLEVLTLSHSSIIEIEPMTFDRLPRSMVGLDLRGNHLKHLILLKLNNLENLQYLYINNTQEMTDTWINGNSQKFNSKQTEQRIKANSDTKILSAQNQISDLFFALRHKKLSDSEVSSTSQFIIENRNQMLIQATQNPYKFKTDPCSVLPYKLETIDLSYSFLLSDVTNMFCGTNNSLKVIVASNQRGSMTSNSLQKLWERMKNLHMLEKLNLNGNHIKELPRDVFSEQAHLKILKLRRNVLVDVTFNIQTLIHLQQLDLSDNRIEYIPSQFSQQIENIAKHSNITVYLHGNKLLCKCDQLDSLAWLLHTRVVFQKDNLTCEYKNGSELALSRISDIHMQLEAECLVLQVLISSIVGFTTVILSLSFVAYICHKRWRFKYLTLIGRRNLNPYHPIEDREILLEYDIYISYDRDHMVNSKETLHELVTQRIYPSLTQRGLKILIREELVIGRKLFDVISNALRRSRKVVVLLSHEYCRDHWNVFEFNMAVMEGIYTKREVVVPVMLETLNPKDLHEEVYTFIRSGPVAKFTFDRNVRDLIDFLFESAR